LFLLLLLLLLLLLGSEVIKLNLNSPVVVGVVGPIAIAIVPVAGVRSRVLNVARGWQRVWTILRMIARPGREGSYDTRGGSLPFLGSGGTVACFDTGMVRGGDRGTRDRGGGVREEEGGKRRQGRLVHSELLGILLALEHAPKLLGKLAVVLLVAAETETGTPAHKCFKKTTETPSVPGFADAVLMDKGYSVGVGIEIDAGAILLLVINKDGAALEVVPRCIQLLAYNRQIQILANLEGLEFVYELIIGKAKVDPAHKRTKGRETHTRRRHGIIRITRLRQILRYSSKIKQRLPFLWVGRGMTHIRLNVDDDKTVLAFFFGWTSSYVRSGVVVGAVLVVVLVVVGVELH
jgi:hypothetical protein